MKKYIVTITMPRGMQLMDSYNSESEFHALSQALGEYSYVQPDRKMYAVRESNY